MPSSRRISKSRRTFLKTIPTAIAVGAAATVPATVAGQPAPPPADAITADTLDTAQQIIGVALPESDRESARPLVTRHLDNDLAIRQGTVPSSTEPAFSFRLPRPTARRPKVSGGGRTAASRTSIATDGHSNGGRRTHSGSVEDLAFAPISVLAHMLETRRISSTELT